jgi:UPF0755 protein
LKISSLFQRFVPVFLLIAAISFSGWGLYMADLREGTPEKAGSEIEVLITPGQSAGDVASEFERLGIVTKSRNFSKWMVKLGIDRRIKPGIYKIHAGRAKEVALEFSQAVPDVLDLRILPGALFDEIASAFGRSDGEFLLHEALRETENFPEKLRPLLPEKARERVVLLAPDTYAIPPGEDCANWLVRIASKAWQRRHGENIPANFTSADVARGGILASIIQKEALVDSDRPTIAGVFKNRLERDMPLQSCATVVYAWKLRGVKITNVSFEDVKIESPFNTYIHKGLPPENIGVPSENSWNAALKPEQTEMLFFVASSDGRHIFSRTYREHLDAQRRIKKGRL